MRPIHGPVAAALAAAAIIGCQEAPQTGLTTAPRAGTPLPAGQTLATEATVRFIAIEGGCWTLITPSGGYAPTSLPAAYQRDGLQVYVVMHDAPDVVSICQIGPLVSLDTIRLR